MNQTSYTMNEGRLEDMRLFISQQVEKGCKAIHSHAEISVKAFYNNLASKIPEWIENYKSYHHVDNILKVNSQAKAFTEELVDSLQSHIKNETKTWAEKSFVPMVGKEISTLTYSINNQANVSHEPLEQINVSIGLNKRAIVRSTTPSAKNKIISTGASLLIGDLGGAIMGGTGGSDAMLKTMGCEFAAGIALGVISLFTPIGLATLIGSVIASAFVGGSWALGSIEKNIRKAVVRSCLENLNSPQEVNNFIDVIHKKIDCLLNPLRQEMAENNLIECVA